MAYAKIENQKGMKAFALLVIFFSLYHGINSKNVQVIDFIGEYTPIDNQQDDISLGSLKTRALTICLRFKARYNADQKLIQTRQFSLRFRKNKKGIFQIHPLNTTSVFPQDFFAIFSFTSAPGNWTSMCLCVTMTDFKLKLKLFQNGNLVWDKMYSDSTGVKFDPLHYNEATPIKQM